MSSVVLRIIVFLSKKNSNIDLTLVIALEATFALTYHLCLDSIPATPYS